MSKRRKIGHKSLSGCELEIRRRFLEHRGIVVNAKDYGNNFDYLFTVCLAYDLQQSPIEHDCRGHPAADESNGVYNIASLLEESLTSSLRHKNYPGLVKVGRVEGSKEQGVLAIRNIQKGELLCVSVPDVVAPNLSQELAPNELLSELTHAQMAARLYAIVLKSQVDRTKLDSLVWAGKERFSNGSDSSLRQICREVIQKYTWAIDHPASKPGGEPLHGSYTKVAGHAFTLHGMASLFNHSCVPNATMVTYGALQFFYANCSIPCGQEVCVSYGYGRAQTVQERKAALFDHAGFQCTCPLCAWESKTSPICTVPIHHMGNVLLDLRHAVQWIPSLADYIQDLSSLAQDEQGHRLLELCTMLANDDSHTIAHLAKDTQIEAVLWTLNELTPLTAQNTSQPVSLSIILSTLLLIIMLLSLNLSRDADIGMQHGDQFRVHMQDLADLLTLNDDLEGAAFWREKSLEYTAPF